MSVRVRADAAVRAQRAFAARVVGATWDEAAEHAGYANGANAIRAVLRHFGRLPQPEVSDLRHLWRERAEWLWAQVVEDVREDRPGSVTAAVRVAERAARLDGLDAPARVEVDGQVTLADYVAQLQAMPTYVVEAIEP